MALFRFLKGVQTTPILKYGRGVVVEVVEGVRAAEVVAAAVHAFKSKELSLKTAKMSKLVEEEKGEMVEKQLLKDCLPQVVVVLAVLVALAMVVVQEIDSVGGVVAVTTLIALVQMEVILVLMVVVVALMEKKQGLADMVEVLFLEEEEGAVEM